MLCGKFDVGDVDSPQQQVVEKMCASKISRVATGSPQPSVLAEAFCGKFDVGDVDSPQQQVVEKMYASKISRVATGSPQPPPGGGLLLYVAGPSARLRAFWIGSIAQRLAGRSLPGAEARSSLPNLRVLRRLRPDL